MSSCAKLRDLGNVSQVEGIDSKLAVFGDDEVFITQFFFYYLVKKSDFPIGDAIPVMIIFRIVTECRGNIIRIPGHAMLTSKHELAKSETCSTFFDGNGNIFDE